MHTNTHKTVAAAGKHQHPKIDPKTKGEASRRIDRVWTSALTGSEMKLVRWLFGVTVEWNHWHGYYSDPQILKGMPKHGIAPVGLSERTLRRVKRSLSSRGVLRVEAHQHRKNCWGKTYYALNLNWEPEQAKLAAGPLQIGRGSAANLAPHTSLTYTSLTGILIPARPSASRMTGSGFKKEETREERPNLPGQARHAETTGDAVSERTKASSGENRETARPGANSIMAPAGEKVAQVNQPPAPPSAPKMPPVRTRTRPTSSATAGKPWEARIDELRKVWEKAWFETYNADAEGNPNGVCPVCPPWSKDERGALLAMARHFYAQPRFPEFLDFAVRRWRVVMLHKFMWMGKNGGAPAPERPTIRFLASQKFQVEFLNAWADQNRITWLNTVPGDLREVEQLRMKGASVDEAALEVAQRNLLGMDRDKRRKDVESAAMYYRMAALAQAEIARRPVPHPDSYLNVPPSKRSMTTDHGFESGAPVEWPNSFPNFEEECPA